MDFTHGRYGEMPLCTWFTGAIRSIRPSGISIATTLTSGSGSRAADLDHGPPGGDGDDYGEVGLGEQPGSRHRGLHGHGQAPVLGPFEDMEVERKGVSGCLSPGHASREGTGRGMMDNLGRAVLDI